MSIVKEQIRLSKIKDPRGILALVEKHIDDFNGRQHATIFNLLKGITNPNHLERIRVDPVFIDLVKRTTERIASNDNTRFFNAIDLGMTIVSAAKIGRMDGTDELFAAISKQSIWIVNHVDAQALANIATAYSKLEITNHQDFFAAINDKDVSRWIVENGKAQEIANIATAFAKLEIVDHKNFFAAINDKKIIKYLMENGNAQDFANIATAFAKLEIVDQKAYFDSLSGKETCSMLINSGNPQNIANISSAFATLGIEDSNNFFLALSVDNTFATKGNAQDVCNSLWSFACLGLLENVAYESIIKSLWSKAISMPVEDFIVEDLRQLRQFYTCSIVEGENLKLKEIPSDLRSKINKVRQSNTDSRSHGDISILLAEIGFEHATEVSPFVDNSADLFSGGDEFMAIDMANLEDRIAVEFDGPSHFLGLGHDGRVESGKTKMKSRMLKKLGWKVIKIPWFEWKEVNRGESWKLKKVEYLKGKTNIKAE